MNPRLRLAAEHLERAADPGAGREINDLRAAEFAQALTNGDNLLAELLPTEDDALVLSPLAWAWLLPIFAQASLRPPDAVLDAIFERTQSPFVRLRVVQATATARADTQATALAEAEDVDPWLYSRLRHVLQPDLGHDAIIFGQLLLQVGNEPARRAFRILYEEATADVREALAGAIPGDASGYAAWIPADAG
jgi:hypothetical protein